MNAQEKLQRAAQYIEQTRHYQVIDPYREVSAEELKRLEVERAIIQKVADKRRTILAVFEAAKVKAASNG